MKRADNAVTIALERLSVSRKHKYAVKKIALPSKKELSQIHSRKDLLEIVHNHDLKSFYANSKSHGSIRNNIRQFPIMMAIFVLSFLKKIFIIIKSVKRKK
ncbi:MAG TPA: hypothetical protein VK766_07610 [Cytophagaceae bacterium]|nr:hypothetical protein [Cytophagaceae bacterium]